MRLWTFLLSLIGVSVAATVIFCVPQSSIVFQENGSASSQSYYNGFFAPSHHQDGVNPSLLIEKSFSLTVLNHSYTYSYPKRLLQEAIQPRGKTPSILFGILSTPENKIPREAIRQSWGRDENLLFIVGGSLTAEVLQEMTVSHDILFLHAEEDYRSGLTRKTMLALHFMDHLCRDLSTCLEYLFKTDDDSYVNTTRLRMELQRTDRHKSHHQRIEYYGEPSVKTEPDRNKTSRFYISEEEYPARYYPNYAYGMGYAVSNKLASCASREMQKVRKQPPWEDVATGAFARRCSVKLTHAQWMLPGMSSAEEVQLFPYEILKNGGMDVTVVHGVKRPDWMLPLHRKEPLL
jgi:beta-1,3-galactosyltransferase 1